MRLGVLGLGAVLSARLVAGCSSGQGEEGFGDAGSLPDVVLTPEDAASGSNDGAPAQGTDASDATIATEDGAVSSGEDSGGSDDAGADVAPGSGHDAGDAGELDASDAAVAAHDAGDAAAGEHDAGDASVAANDAGSSVDGGSGSDDAGASVDATTGVDASDAGSSEDASDASLAEDANDAASAEDASDAALACVSCGTTITFLGNTAAYLTGSATTVGLQGGTVPGGSQVTVVTQTYPQNSVATLHLFYSTASDFSNAVDLPMTFDHTVMNNDQWYAILPAEVSGVTMSWYMRADGCDCSASLYGQPAPEVNYTYTEQ